MNPAILTKEVQNFLSQNIRTDSTKIILGKSPFPHVSSRELAEQIESKKRCEKKIPLWFETPGIYFPAKLSIEQASSEATGIYKSQLIRGSVIDLTGGLGVDCHYFALVSKQVIYCELNMELLVIAQYNATVLSDRNIHFVRGDGLDYLKWQSEASETIYIDPSRRVNSRKVFLLKDCEPNVPGNLDFLMQKASRIVIKTSPLLDIQSGLKELRYVSQIHVLSLKNECKELVWVLDRDFDGEPEIVCSALNGLKPFAFHISEERKQEIKSFSEPLAFLYEPDAALLKAGCFKLIAHHWNLEKLHQHSHIYTSENKVANFMGRTFRIEQSMDYKTFIKTSGIKKANIISRNFPLTADELRKKHKIEDGGEIYLIFTKSQGERLIVVVGKRENG